MNARSRVCDPPYLRLSPSTGDKVLTTGDPPILQCTKSTPLHYAAARGQLGVVLALLEYGADVGVRTSVRSKQTHAAGARFVNTLTGQYYSLSTRRAGRHHFTLLRKAAALRS